MKLIQIAILILLLFVIPAHAADTTVAGNDGAAIQRAINEVSNGGTVTVPAGDYQITRRVYQGAKSFNLVGSGTVNIHLNTGDGSQNGFYFEGTRICYGTITQNAKAGDSSIILNDASQIQDGDLSQIWKNVLWCPLDYNDQLTGEMYKVESVSGNTVTLNEPLLRDYKLSDTVKTSVNRPIEVHVSGLRFLDSGTTTDHEALSLRDCIDSSVTDCFVSDSGISGISFYSSFNVEVTNNEIQDCMKPGSGYGVGLWSGVAYALVEGNKILNCRHCVTGNTDERISLIRGVTINNNYMTGGETAGANVVDAHNVVLDYIVTNNEIYPGSSYYAFGDGTLTSLFEGNRIYGGYGAYANRGSTDNGVHIIRNNYVEGDSVFLYRGMWWAKSSSLLIEGNTQVGGRDGVNIDSNEKELVAFDDIIIRGNTFKDIPGSGVMIKCNQPDMNVEVSDNVFNDIGGNDVTVSSNSYNGGTVRLIQNKYDLLDLDKHVKVSGMEDLSANGKSDMNINIKDVKVPERASQLANFEKIEIIKDSKDYIVVVGTTGADIQKALDKAVSGDVVFLPAGTYDVYGPIYFKGSGVTMLGEHGTIIRVAETKTQWFRGLTGIINSIGHDDITIESIILNGNSNNLDPDLADSSPSTSHDCGRGIVISGTSDKFVNNIRISGVIVENTLSDGIHIRYVDTVIVEDSEFSNCQHEGVYFVCVRNGMMLNLSIAGITSDCARLDNCEKVLIRWCTFFSYTGDKSGGQYQGGQNGLQISDQGYSMGGGSDKSGTIHTNNIEVANNVFANCGMRSIWLDSAKKGLGENIYIHDNEFVGMEELATNGVAVDVNGIPIDAHGMAISETNAPTLEMTHNIFSSIFSILDWEIVETGITDQKPDSCEWTVKAEEKGGVLVRVEIVGYKNQIWYNNQWWVSSPDDLIVKTQAIQRPVFSWVGDSVEKIDENVSISTVGNNTTATFSVTTTFKHKTKNAKTGKTRTTRYTQSSVTTDSIETMPVLDVPANVSGVIYVYPTSFQVSVPSNMLTRVEYEYDGNKSTHVYQVGTRNTTETGIIFTEFSPLERWFGDLGHQGDYINVMGVFNQDKLKVVACTPYGEIEVTDFKIIRNEYPEKAIAKWLYPFIIALGILFLYLKSLYNDFKKY